MRPGGFSHNSFIVQNEFQVVTAMTDVGEPTRVYNSLGLRSPKDFKKLTLFSNGAVITRARIFR